MQLAAVPTKSAYAVFVGSINQESAQRICNGVTTAMAGGFSELHLLFQSVGGMVAEGVFLYNFLRACPLEISIYNSGSVASIAALSYLGAKTRYVSAHATFMLHSTHFSPQGANAGLLESFAETARMDDARSNSIIDHHVRLSDEQKRIKEHRDLWLTANEAKSVGLATNIGEFSPPLGQQIFYV